MLAASTDPETAAIRSLPSQLVAHGRTRERRAIAIDIANEWSAEYASTRSEEVRDRIIAAHQWLVCICARQMRRRNESLDDLIQVGNIGLFNAVERFDPAFGVSFHTYATATIVGELRRHYRTVWQVHVPRRLQEQHLAVQRAMDDLTGRLGRSATAADIAEHLRLPVSEVREALRIGGAGWVGQLPDDESRAGGGEDESGIEARLSVQELLAKLPTRQRSLLVLWLMDGLPQDEIGRRFGMSQVQVSRSVRRSLAMLRSVLARERHDPEE